MCKWSKWGDTRIDPCMKCFIDYFNSYCADRLTILACCCGHSKYPMSLVVKDKNNNIFEMFSGIEIPRPVRFYKRDKQGYYYIPEVQNG